MSGWSSLTTLKRPQHTKANQYAWLLQGMGSSTFGVGRYTTPRRDALLLLTSQIAKQPHGHVIITLETVKMVSLSDTRGRCLISPLVMSNDVSSGYGRLQQRIFSISACLYMNSYQRRNLDGGLWDKPPSNLEDVPLLSAKTAVQCPFAGQLTGPFYWPTKKFNFGN